MIMHQRHESNKRETMTQMGSTSSIAIPFNLEHCLIIILH
jgi:hypothetical protein